MTLVVRDAVELNVVGYMVVRGRWVATAVISTYSYLRDLVNSFWRSRGRNLRLRSER